MFRLFFFSRFPEDALYFSEGSWRLIKIGEGPLGFGEWILSPKHESVYGIASSVISCDKIGVCACKLFHSLGTCM